MAESVTHLRLVESLIAHISATYRGFAVFHDLPSLVGAEKPPRIAGFVPDVYAVDAPTTVTVVGEAKTDGDLLTEHSREQLAAFLRYLALRRAGILVLAVSWKARATAKNLLISLQSELACTHVGIVVLDGVRSEEPCSK